MSTVAIILARGGSKRIPKKNLHSFRGRPLLAWAAEAALGWSGFDQVIISTDCPEIEAYAYSLGAISLGLRSAEAASDTASTNDAVLDALQRMAQGGTMPQYACAMYATAVFIEPWQLQTAQDMLDQQHFDLVFPVVRFSYPIWRALHRGAQGETGFLWPEHSQTRSQDLPATFHDAGQFYFFRTRTLLETGSLTGGRTGSFELPETHCHDIDHLVDLQMAEIKHARLHAGILV